MFEQYLIEQYESWTSTASPHEMRSFSEWCIDLSYREWLDYGNKAMEELHNGMNLEIVETQ